MTIKNFLLGRMNRVFTRADLPPHDAAAHTVGDADVALRTTTRGRSGPGRALTSAGLEHLGAYRPLVAAIREELERFVSSDLRLHLAIAEHDRYVLTAIVIDSVGPDDHRGLLKRFIREFAPEQLKHYLAKEIIARLPNAGAIDLTQFAGLDTSAEPAAAANADAAYDDLIAALRSDEPETAKPYEVTLVGRWSEMDRRVASGSESKKPLASPATPLAGRRVAMDIEDGGGSRVVELPTVVPGRRYVVGKDADCDIVVTGVYASRRHCELWLDKGTWWVTDCGSTNGIRVEPPAAGGLTRGALLTSSHGDGKALAVETGARIVLSASAKGDATQYPRIAFRPVELAARADATQAQSTPVTPIIAPRRATAMLAVTARMASGEKTVEIPPDAPLHIGRSRTQQLVVDWAHEGVSGHHVDVVEPGEDGARVVVHGDNGVTVDGTEHATDTQFQWKIGETMLLGRALRDEPACALTLSRAS